MTTAPGDPWAEQASDDIIGCILQSPGVGALVGELVNPDDLDPRHQRLLSGAVELPRDVDVDLHGLDDMDGLGPHLLVGSQCIVELPLLARIISVATASGESVMDLARMVIELPCSPCPGCITRAATEVRRAAERRRALAAAAALQRRIVGGDPVAIERVLELAGATP